MVNVPSGISNCDSHSPVLLDLFISSDASICSTMAFPPLGNSDHVVSVSIDFPTNSQQDAPFHRIAYDYSHADWDGLCDHLRDVPWEDIFKLGASPAASGFVSEVGINVSILHHKYQIKSPGMEITIFSSVGSFYADFLNSIFKNISCNNNLLRCGKLIFRCPLAYV